MISNTLEMRPYVRSTQEAEAGIRYLRAFQGRAASISDDYMNMDYGYYDPVRAFSTALMLKDWMDEVKGVELVKKYGPLRPESSTAR